MNRTLGAITVVGARCCIRRFEVMSATVDCARTGLRGYCHALIRRLWPCACGAPQIIWWSASARKCVPRSEAIDLRAVAIPASPRCMPHACARRSRRTADPVHNAPGVVRAIASCMISRPITRTKSVSTASHAGRRIPRVSHAGPRYAGVRRMLVSWREGRTDLDASCGLSREPGGRRSAEAQAAHAPRAQGRFPREWQAADRELRAHGAPVRARGTHHPTPHRLVAL